MDLEVIQKQCLYLLFLFDNLSYRYIKIHLHIKTWTMSHHLFQIFNIVIFKIMFVRKTDFLLQGF